jgi:hypothetical protein
LPEAAVAGAGLEAVPLDVVPEAAADGALDFGCSPLNEGEGGAGSSACQIRCDDRDCSRGQDACRRLPACHAISFNQEARGAGADRRGGWATLKTRSAQEAAAEAAANEAADAALGADALCAKLCRWPEENSTSTSTSTSAEGSIAASTSAASTPGGAAGGGLGYPGVAFPHSALVLGAGGGRSDDAGQAGQVGDLVCPSTFRDMADFVVDFPFAHFGERVHIPAIAKVAQCTD